MKLEKKDLLWLEREYRRYTKRLKNSELKGTFRMVARQEAIVIMIELAGYSFDEEVGRIIKANTEYLFGQKDGTIS
jgi:hypothetical protein